MKCTEGDFCLVWDQMLIYANAEANADGLLMPGSRSCTAADPADCGNVLPLCIVSVVENEEQKLVRKHRNVHSNCGNETV